MQEAKLLLKEDDELIREVFEYWSRKRKLSKSGSPGTLVPVVKQEKRDCSNTSDPYVAFRRRTEKMQTRKVSVPSLFLILTLNAHSCFIYTSNLFLFFFLGCVCKVRLLCIFIYFAKSQPSNFVLIFGISINA